MSNDKFLQYFCERTDERLEIIELKLDRLLSFKWTILGAVSAISFFVTLITTIIFR